MWPGMLPEVLNMISRKYIVYYEDYLTFARVCKSWHSAAAQQGHDYKNGLPSRFPSLILAEKKKNGREFHELFFLSNKSLRKIRLPEAYGKVCSRSSCGWLITAARDQTSQLINPISCETINLPKTCKRIRKLLILTNNLSSLKLPLVVVLWRSSNQMGFCRPGDNKWTAVTRGSLHTCDLTYYNRQVYTIEVNTYTIRACDVHGEDPTTLVYKSNLWAYLYDHKQVVCGVPYIIGLDEGERKTLLVAIRPGMVDGNFTNETYKTKRFRIFAYDLKEGTWSTVKNLGKKTLFVGRCSTFWVEDTTRVIKSNCIYFTDDGDSFYRGDLGIYHLSDETIEPHFVGEPRSFLTPPIWLESLYYKVY